jgi:hypothetical protein
VTELASTPQLPAWESFYVIVGSAAAALIAVQFVVITLIATMGRRTTASAIGAFATPTVVHLGAVLLASALMSAPWPLPAPASTAVATCGLAGLGYTAIVVRRARRQRDYRPVWEDWLWHAALPWGAYALLAVAAFFLDSPARSAGFAIGGAALALLFIGIHNAWDAVTHLITDGDAGRKGA